ncbi:hypothetical protein AMTRI_Chr09g13640 [Amborella trichopoda]
MLGAVQIGVLAACIVLFVPMGMAGWHLSRNKMLFFSGALFITLAVGVHLMPYFPSLSSIVSTFSSVVVVENRDSCISFLHDMDWKNDSMLGELSMNSSSSKQSWTWSQSSHVLSCEFQKLGRTHVLDLLNGSWIVVSGDSEARLFVLSLLGLMLGTTESIENDLFKRHSNYETLVEENGAKVDFIWAPFPINLTDILKKFEKEHKYPDVLVMGSGLWHMLHFTNASNYGELLGSIRKSVVSLLPFSPEFGIDGPVAGSVSIQSPHMFWLGMPMLINSMLNTEAKKEKMTEKMCDAYESELYRSRLLRRSGGPLVLLDIRSLSLGCGSHCTEDGMHYDVLIYDAAVHIMLNALLIESHQRI